MKMPDVPISLLSQTVAEFWRTQWHRALKRPPILPRAMHFLPTYRCNARCVMCGIWREEPQGDELSQGELKGLLKDPLFSKLRYVGISGGEPFIRHDLGALAGAFLESCPKIERISITTNGLLPERIEKALPELVRLSRASGSLLNVSISCHAHGNALNHVYGVPDAFDRIVRTLDLLTPRQDQGELTVSLNAVLLKDTLPRARELFEWARKLRLPISFVVGEIRDRFRNLEDGEHFLGEEDTPALLAFLEERSRSSSLRNLSALRYREIAGILTGTLQRSLACYYALGGVLMGHDGTLFYCSHSKAIGNCREKSPYEIFFQEDNLLYRKQELLEKECKTCPPYTLTRWELQADLHKVLSLLAREKLLKLSGRGSEG